MVGTPIDGFPTFTYADNKSVIVSSSVPESTLKKKSSSIAYSFAREGCAADEWRAACASASGSPSDLMTKCLAPGEKREKFAGMLARYASSAVPKNVMRWKKKIAQHWG